MTYEESVQKHEWRSVAIHRVVALARATRDSNRFVNMEFENCVGIILRADRPKKAQEAMKKLLFKVQKHADNGFYSHIMKSFAEII